MNIQKAKTYGIHLGLFILTLISTTLAGASHKNYYSLPYREFNGVYHEVVDEWGVYLSGLYYSIPFLTILTFHEFGHYFVARYYKLDVTLPYYIPLPFISLIGTMGAVIRLKSIHQTKKQFFDVGIAGPLAGFVVAIGFIWYGFATLPPAESIYEIHPEYEQFGSDYADHVYEKDFQNKLAYEAFVIDSAEYYSLSKAEQEKAGQPPKFDKNTDRSVLKAGDNLLFLIFKHYVAENPEDVPNNFELLHNPWLFAGYLALLFTSINLLPIGQLDGGHILYGLIGRKKHRIISPIIFGLFVFYAGIGLIDLETFTHDELLLWIPGYTYFLYLLFRKHTKGKRKTLIIALSFVAAQLLLNVIFPNLEGYPGWFLFAFILSRLLGVYHPGSFIEEKMDRKRIVLGWIALIVFVLSFIPQPFIFYS